MLAERLDAIKILLMYKTWVILLEWKKCISVLFVSTSEEDSN